MTVDRYGSYIDWPGDDEPWDDEPDEDDDE